MTALETLVVLFAVMAIMSGAGAALAFAELLTRIILALIDHYRDWRFRRRWVRRAPWYRRLAWRS